MNAETPHEGGGSGGHRGGPQAWGSESLGFRAGFASSKFLDKPFSSSSPHTPPSEVQFVFITLKRNYNFSAIG